MGVHTEHPTPPPPGAGCQEPGMQFVPPASVAQPPGTQTSPHAAMGCTPAIAVAFRPPVGPARLQLPPPLPLPHRTVLQLPSPATTIVGVADGDVTPGCVLGFSLVLVDFALPCVPGAVEPAADWVGMCDAGMYEPVDGPEQAENTIDRLSATSASSDL